MVMMFEMSNVELYEPTDNNNNDMHRKYVLNNIAQIAVNKWSLPYTLNIIIKLCQLQSTFLDDYDMI